MKFGPLFKLTRQGKGITQTDASEMTNPPVDRSYLSKIETGNQDPSLHVMSQLLQGLRLTRSEEIRFLQKLFFEEDPPEGIRGFRSEEV